MTGFGIVKFLIGFVAGGGCGFLTAALLAASGRDECDECALREFRAREGEPSTCETCGHGAATRGGLACMVRPSFAHTVPEDGFCHELKTR